MSFRYIDCNSRFLCLNDVVGMAYFVQTISTTVMICCLIDLMCDKYVARFKRNLSDVVNIDIAMGKIY